MVENRRCPLNLLNFAKILYLAEMLWIPVPESDANVIAHGRLQRQSHVHRRPGRDLLSFAAETLVVICSERLPFFKEGGVSVAKVFLFVPGKRVAINRERFTANDV